MTETVQTEEHGNKSTAMNGLRSALAVILICAAIAQAADLYRAVGFLLYPQQYMAGILALALPLTFLTYDFRQQRRHGSVPWYDILTAAIAFATAAFIAVRYPVLSELVFQGPTEGLISGHF